MEYLVVGLGNPGEKFETTRHNAGWLALDFAYPDLSWGRDSYADAGTAVRDGIVFAKPATFMNLSGETVGYFVAKKGVLPENVIVLYDDLDLPIGRMKISFDRGSGGHNGIRSIESHLGSRQFVRIRIGISKTLPDGSLSKPNVLGNFEPDELKALEDLAPKIRSAIRTVAEQGREKAMTEFNQ